MSNQTMTTKILASRIALCLLCVGLVSGCGEKTPCETTDVESCNAAISAALDAGDDPLTFQLADQACERDNAAMCGLLGLLLQKGTGTVKDVEGALVAYQKGCGLGNPRSCQNGFHRASEVGNEALGFHMLERICELDSPEQGMGCSMLADAHRKGTGTVVDLAASMAAYERGCDAGDLHACVQVAARMEFGEFPADPPRIRALYQKACEGGNADGCEGLRDLRPPSSARRRTSDEVLTAHGIEWTVSGTLSSRLRLKKVECDGRRPRMTCNLTIGYPQGWDVSDRPARAVAFDSDGVQTSRNIVSTHGIGPGGAARSKTLIDTSTKRVVIGQ